MENGINWKREFIKVRRKSSPYQVTLSNTVAAPAIPNFVLLGANRNGNRPPTYGSSVGVVYQVMGGLITYPELLQQSQSNPFNVKWWTISSSNAANLSQSLLFNWRDANGTVVSEAITLPAYIDMYQVSQTSIMFKYPCRVDGKFWMSGTFINGSTLTITPYPDTIIDPSKLLFDEGDLESVVSEQFEEPEISKFLTFLNEMRNGK